MTLPHTRVAGPTKEKKQQRDNNGVTEYQWLAIPEPLVWTDWEDVVPSETRNRVEGDWEDTGRVQTDPVIDVDEKEQTRTITYDKRQRSANQCDEERFSWLGVSETQTRWVEGTPVLVPTSVPNNITADPSARSVDISWDPVARATGYGVEIGIPPSAGGLGPTSDTTTGTSITIGNLLPLQTYEYRVQATNTSGDGPWSDWATVVTSAPPPPPPVTPLPAPTNVMAEPTHNSVRVSWRVVGGATGYVVEIGIPPSAGGLGPTSDPTTGTSITISNLLPWTTYEYRVKATAEGRIGTWSGWATVVTSAPPPPPPVTPLPAPTNVMAEPTHNSVRVSWRVVGGATGYVVEIGIPPSAGGLVHTSHPTNDLSITIPNLLASQTYEYRVKATAEGRTGTWTTWATVVTSAPPPPPPPITSTWVDTGRTRNRVEGIWRDTGNQRENQILLIMEKEQTRTVTWEKEQIDSTGNVTEPQWIPASEVETQWIPVPPPPPPSIWVDTGRTRNRVEGIWRDTGNQRENQILLIMEKEQTRTVTWEKEQIDSTGNVTEPQWVSTSRTETQWVPVTPPPITHVWTFVSNEGCGPTRKRVEECTNGHTRHTRKEDASEPLVWTAFADVSPAVTRNRVEGQWRDTGNQRENQILLIFEKEQNLTITWQKKQMSTNQCDDVEYDWADASSTQTRWRIIPEECGSWRDVAGSTRVKTYGTYSNVVPAVYSGSGASRRRKQTRTNTREKQQSCTTNAPYYNTRYQWVDTTSTTETRWVADPPPPRHP